MNCLTFSELATAALDVILVAFFIGGIVGMCFAAYLMKSKN